MDKTDIISMSSDTFSINDNSKLFDLVHEYSQKVATLETVSDIFWEITHFVCPKIGLVDCVIYDVNRQEQTLLQKAAYGDKNPSTKTIKNILSLKFREGHAGLCAATGQSILIEDNSIDEQYLQDTDFRYSEISIPIKHGNAVLAVIDSEHPEKGFYTVEHIKFFEVIAAITSGFIMKIKEKDEFDKLKEELKDQIDQQSDDLELAIETLSHQYSELKHQNDKREVLLQEVHHRVNNNLQIITSLLRLYIANSTQDTSELIEIQNRVSAMALIHQNIYRSVEMNKVDVESYMHDLVNHIKGYHTKRHVSVTTVSEAKYLSLNTLVPFGLLLTELCSVILQNNYSEDQKTCHIRLNLKPLKGTDQFIMEICDDGKQNFYKTWDFENETDVASILVGALVDQVEGELKLSNEKDHCITLKFNNL